MGAGSKAAIAQKFGLSLSTVKRITQGLTQSPQAGDVLHQAISNSASVTIDGLDVTAYVKRGIDDLAAAAIAVPPKSKEGMATAMLRYLQFYAQLHPPTMDAMVDQLLGMPDFDPARFVKLLKEKYAQQRGGTSHG